MNIPTYHLRPIHSFDQIVLQKYRPLVICDIDETLLYCKKTQIPSYNCLSLLTKDHIDDILPTDMNGFLRMKQRISSLNGKLVFLTARSIRYSNYLKVDFEQIGLEYENFEVHYTGNRISKGRYMNLFIDNTGFGEIIFIDDLIENHDSMHNYFPAINKYLFQCRV